MFKIERLDLYNTDDHVASYVSNKLISVFSFSLYRWIKNREGIRRL